MQAFAARSVVTRARAGPLTAWGRRPRPSRRPRSLAGFVEAGARPTLPDSSRSRTVRLRSCSSAEAVMCCSRLDITASEEAQEYRVRLRSLPHAEHCDSELTVGRRARTLSAGRDRGRARIHARGSAAGEELARLTGRAGRRRQPSGRARRSSAARMTYFEMSEPGPGLAGCGTHSAGSLIGRRAPKGGAIRIASSAAGRDSISGRSWGKLSSTRMLVAI